MPPRCSSHVIIWLVLVGPLLGLLYAFLLLDSSSPNLSLGLYSCYFGLHYSISSLSSSLGPFYSFRHPWPVSFPWASLAHFNPLFPWAFAKSFGLPRPKSPYPLLSRLIGISTTPIYLIPSFGFLQPILACFPFLIMTKGLLLFSSSFFRSACFLWGPFAILQAYGPLFLPFGVNDFLLNLLILLLYSLPYCWASYYYWASLPKWALAHTLSGFLGVVTLFHFLCITYKCMLFYSFLESLN